MPDISNEDIMKLIYRVIKKVDTLEQKMDLLLQKCDGFQAKQAEEELNFFKFFRIDNENDLQRVSQDITNDEEYKNKLIQQMQRKPDLKLTDIFTDNFLYNYNYSGTMGKKSILNLVPYEQIYVYLKTHRGDSPETIRQSVALQFKKCKNRFHVKTCRKTRELKLAAVNVVEEPENVEEIESEMDLSDNEPEENIELSSSDEENNCFNFTPIANDNELQKVSEAIKTDPQFLKQLRLQIVEESDDGQCKLEQLYSNDFIYNSNLTGTQGKRKLADCHVYKAVYLFLKKHMGLTQLQIEEDAKNEIKKIKNRFHVRTCRIKRDGNKFLKKEMI